MYGQEYGRKLVKPLRIEKNKNRQKKEPKLDSARKLRSICFIDPDDKRVFSNSQKRQKKTGKTYGTSHAMQKDGQAASQYHESHAKQWQRKGVQNNVWLKPTLDSARKLRGIYTFDPDGACQEVHWVSGSGPGRKRVRLNRKTPAHLAGLGVQSWPRVWKRLRPVDLFGDSFPEHKRRRGL